MTEVFRGVIDGERWEVIFGGLYAVSDHGRLMRTAAASGTTPGKILTPGTNRRGYHYFNLHLGQQPLTREVHVLVAMAFIGDRAGSLIVNHKDCVKLNNHWTNLEYITQRENVHHAFHNVPSMLKLSESQIGEIRRKFTCGVSDQAIAAEYGCSRRHINGIRRGENRMQAWGQP